MIQKAKKNNRIFGRFKKIAIYEKVSARLVRVNNKLGEEKKVS